MARRKKKTRIPGVTFSWRRALGITKLKRKFAKETGIPLTKAGWERKIGRMVIDLFSGKGLKSKKDKDNSSDVSKDRIP